MHLSRTLSSVHTPRRRPLLDVRHMKDAELQELLLGSEWAPLFDLPSTLPKAVAAYFGNKTPCFIVSVLFATAAARGGLAASGGGPLTTADLAVAGAVALFWMFQEWVLHDKVLHSEAEWLGKDIHAFHHDLPYYHVSIDGLKLAAAWFTLAAGAAAALFPTWGLALTATATYTTCGLVYEFAHYISHTRVPLPPPLAALRAHHQNHHLVCSHKWLAFTLPAVDALMGTMPRHPRDVPEAERNHNCHNRRPLSPLGQ